MTLFDCGCPESLLLVKFITITEGSMPIRQAVCPDPKCGAYAYPTGEMIYGDLDRYECARGHVLAAGRVEMRTERA